MKRIILASSSPRRKELLEKIGLKFEVDASNCAEEIDPALEPDELAAVMALRGQVLDGTLEDARWEGPRRRKDGTLLHLRFAVCYWHTFKGGGSDMFGPAAWVREWNVGTPMEAATKALEANFEFCQKLGVPYYCFHDRDIAPEGASVAESAANLEEIVEQAKQQARKFGVSFDATTNMEEGFKDADIVYAKSWGAMLTTPDQEEGAKIIKKYSSWITDERKMKLAKPDAIYMHPLPADRNVEVTDGVMDGPNSVVYDEAENRMHAQKAVMALTMS